MGDQRRGKAGEIRKLCESPACFVPVPPPTPPLQGATDNIAQTIYCVYDAVVPGPEF